MRISFLFLCSWVQLLGVGSIFGQDAQLILVPLENEKGWGLRLNLHQEQVFDPSSFQVFTAQEWSNHYQEGQSIAGRKEKLDQQIWVFYPYLPFTEGMEYVAFYPGSNVLRFQLPKKDHLPTKVLAIYPEKDTIPENLLKMYLYFSAPMSVGKSYKHLHWMSAEGDTLDLPFLQLEPELWNEDRTRLTLWLDPGRVKRNLVPHQLLGAPLVEGENYILQVDKDWKDKHGKPVEHEMAFQFTVGKADRQKPIPASWKLVQPLNGSRDPLILHFDEVLDYALLQHTITIWDRQDQLIKGSVEVAQQQQEWYFYPDLPWTFGKYQIRIDSKLEDLAGNNLNRLFDVDLQARDQAPTSAIYHFLEFIIR